MDWTSFVICFTGWLLGSFVNGISGMGAGIFALPIVLLVIDIKTAALISCAIAIPLPGTLTWQFRKHIRLSDLRPLFLGSFPGMVLGVLMLPVVPARFLQISLGIMLVAYMFWHMLVHQLPVLGSPRLWGTTSGAVGGFIQAIGGLGGPPLGMYAQLSRWDKDRTRGNLGAYFVGTALPIIAMQVFAGYYTPYVIRNLIPCLLGCAVGLVLGYPVARRIGEVNFQRLLTAVIGLSGLSILIRALLEG